MNMNISIIETHGKTSIWPGKDNAMLVTCIDSTGTSCLASIPDAEYHLARMVQSMRSYTPKKTITLLTKMIEDYGQECYNKADTDNAIANAGADI